MVTGLLHRSCL